VVLEADQEPPPDALEHQSSVADLDRRDNRQATRLAKWSVDGVRRFRQSRQGRAGRGRPRVRPHYRGSEKQKALAGAGKVESSSAMTAMLATDGKRRRRIQPPEGVRAGQIRTSRSQASISKKRSRSRCRLKPPIGQHRLGQAIEWVGVPSYYPDGRIERPRDSPLHGSCLIDGGSPRQLPSLR